MNFLDVQAFKIKIERCTTHSYLLSLLIGDISRVKGTSFVILSDVCTDGYAGRLNFSAYTQHKNRTNNQVRTHQHIPRLDPRWPCPTHVVQI